MKNSVKRFLAALLAVFIFIGTASGAFAAGQPSSYSASKNSGQRDVVATTLSGTNAANYYTGSYTYDNLSGLSSSALLSSLRTLIIQTHDYKSSYDDCKNKANYTDCENGSGKLVTLYTSYTTGYNASIVNREHVWPKSLGGYKTSGPGADLHHIRPTEITPNSNRGSLKYGNVSGGKASYGNASDYLAGYYGSYFEPLDNVKGDVARICLYMYVRYGGESQYTCSSITTVFQSVDVLLEWCELDPVDTWELGRNEVVESIQGNRNVFIDYPEYAWLIFGYDVPSDMVTPSGEAMNGGTGDTGCKHVNTSTVGAQKASCEASGYTGDTVCSDCGETVREGSAISATGHSFGAWVTDTEDNLQRRTCSECGKEETGNITGADTPCSHEHTETVGVIIGCEELGYSGDTVCSDCGKTLVEGTQTLPEGHKYGANEILKEPTEDERGLGRRVCTTCGNEEIFLIEKVKKEPSTEVVVVASAAGGSVTLVGVLWFIFRKRRV